MSNENKILSKSAQRVQQALAQKGLSFELIELSASTRTANDAANTIGCDVAQIVKSLLFCTAKTSQPVLVLASGINRVNEKIIEQWVGEKIVKADAGFTREVTGFAIGGVPPVGHKQTITHIFIDEDLLQHHVLWAAAGTPYAVFSLSSREIESLTHGKIIAIK
ncbi:YbaK/EbsC family protein [Legionella maioricensis]|uniref:YbaK/EbsC family protein n=1 Tax=Legionella maioricensis TaxID=2896528 RepID=A0A9X2D3P2_9GAMM|nr:YbaK/EbsC family protein [Legionella maioricensis]MCL9685682.1 YbaK/EbsC family protein [Legionella maioricensis]MCL9689096.1 YbaK/EbsC family protein [Legionella maioricensis]